MSREDLTVKIKLRYFQFSPARGLRSGFNESQCSFLYNLNFTKVHKVSLSNLNLCDLEKNSVKGNQFTRAYFKS